MLIDRRARIRKLKRPVSNYLGVHLKLTNVICFDFVNLPLDVPSEVVQAVSRVG
jgi:hypothetical protein